ncbi:hypothetical protein ACIBQ1_16995 [Nonomuraea sp. NPDC050153]|uniref:hypothetical protein n=1 Tax=Nonomuraea sp. NPDC050153 TaxID=3364359 RepID=UPI0037BA1702
MTDSPPFAVLEDLLGCRTDDPRLVELHQAYGLDAPATFSDRYGVDAEGVDECGWSLVYKATARIPGSYPPPRVRGRGKLLGYLTQIDIVDGYTPPLREGITIELSEPEARARALESRVAEYGNIVHVLERDERTMLEARYHGDGRFIWFSLRLNELDEDDPELLRAAEQVRVTFPVRTIPDWPEPDVNEPFPPALQALNAYQDAPGFGEIDFEMLDRFDPGSVTANGRTDAEREFRVFAINGSGSQIAFWLVHEGLPAEQQPVVFLGDEGDVGAVATDLCDLLYLLASGNGPFEVIMFGVDEDAEPQPGIAAIAEVHFDRREGRTPEAILADAAAEYSDVQDRIDVLGRW